MKNNPIFQSWINETKEGQLLQTKPHSKTQLQIAFEAGQRYEQIKQKHKPPCDNYGRCNCNKYCTNS